jgi:hypothetical protein
LVKLFHSVNLFPFFNYFFCHASNSFKALAFYDLSPLPLLLMVLVSLLHSVSLALLSKYLSIQLRRDAFRA